MQEHPTVPNAPRGYFDNFTTFLAFFLSWFVPTRSKKDEPPVNQDLTQKAVLDASKRFEKMETFNIAPNKYWTSIIEIVKVGNMVVIPESYPVNSPSFERFKQLIPTVPLLQTIHVNETSDILTPYRPFYEYALKTVEILFTSSEDAEFKKKLIQQLTNLCDQLEKYKNFSGYTQTMEQMVTYCPELGKETLLVIKNKPTN